MRDRARLLPLNGAMLPGFPGMRCVWEGPALLGEGPVWCPDEGALYFVDIKAPAILRLNPDGSVGYMPVSSAVGAIALRRGGGLVAALRDGLAMMDGAICHYGYSAHQKKVCAETGLTMANVTVLENSGWLAWTTMRRLRQDLSGV